MAVFKVLVIGDPILREKANPVTKINPALGRLLNDMAETMYANSGVGLAGPQVGVLKRVIVVDTGDGLYQLVNPEITSAEGAETDREGCLSIPGVWGEVTRAAKVKVRALNPRGETVEIDAQGLFARALQHEIDHLDGILFVDRAVKTVRVGG
ncbi:MAG TPA: peptide deformylase [Desulfotomaculum sp.]|nr:peptide deformylase [Desulfotomaculum sp.]